MKIKQINVAGVVYVMTAWNLNADAHHFSL